MKDRLKAARWQIYISSILSLIIGLMYVIFPIGTSAAVSIIIGVFIIIIAVTVLLGGIMGVSIGFCIGSAGSMSVKVKSGILMAVSMVLCFMSGLMAANMKPLLAAKLPWLNNINPAAVVTDAISALNLYSDYSVFTGKMVTMLIITAVFSLGGFILTRRKKYASL